MGRWACGVLFLLAACGDDDAGPGVDAGPPDAGGDAEVEPVAPARPAEPAPPARPVLTPCPVGWREVADPDWPDVVTCDPWPEGGPATCEGAFAQFPGEEGCARIGTTCPAGRWPEDLPAGATVLYVDAAAAEGGDGSEQAPFARVADAIRAASAGTVVAIAPGTYEEAVVLDEAITLWGACAEDTVIARRDDAGPVVHVRTDGGATLENLTLEGGGSGLRVSRTDARSFVLDVVVRGAESIGIDVERADLTVTSSVVRDCAGPWSSAGIWPSGGSLDLDRVAIERAGITGLRADGGAHVDATALVVSHTLTADPSLFPGDGVLIAEGAAAELRESAIHHTFRNGVRLGDPDTEVTLRDCAIQDIQPFDDLGTGVYADAGGLVRLERVGVERTHAVAIAVDGEGSVLEATDVVTRDTTPFVDDLTSGGFGIIVDHGAVGTLARAAVLRASGDGLLVAGTAAAEDISVLATRKATAGRGGTWAEGITLYGGRLELRRAELAANDGAGLMSSAELLAEDVFVHDGGSEPTSADRAQGIVVYGHSRAEIHRVRLEGNRAVGLAVEGQAVASGDDVTVIDTGATPEGLDGHGITVDIWSSADLRRVLVRGNRTAGVAVTRYADATFEDLTIDRTIEADCAADGCDGGGFGLQIMGGGTGSVRRFRIEGNALAGVQVAPGGALELHQGAVVGNPIGANVQEEGFVVDELMDEVLWDNERNFDSRILPVPGIDSTLVHVSGGCRGGPSEPLDLVVEPIGAPTWEPRGFFQTSFLAPTGFAAPLTELLAPNHLFAEDGLYWGPPHAPPYDDEWVDAFERGHCTSGTTFGVEDVAPPSIWGFFYMIVPIEGAATGRSPDADDGPILDDEVYPISCSGDLYRNGELFEPNFDTPYVGMEDILPGAYDGFSHQPAFDFTITADVRSDDELVGDYEYREELVDETGNGWRLTTRFVVE